MGLDEAAAAAAALDETAPPCRWCHARGPVLACRSASHSTHSRRPHGMQRMVGFKSAAAVVAAVAAAASEAGVAEKGASPLVVAASPLPLPSSVIRSRSQL